MENTKTICRGNGTNIMTTAAWLAKHRDHGDLTVARHGHPDGTWRWLICECGARHLTNE